MIPKAFSADRSLSTQQRRLSGSLDSTFCSGKTASNRQLVAPPSRASSGYVHVPGISANTIPIDYSVSAASMPVWSRASSPVAQNYSVDELADFVRITGNWEHSAYGEAIVDYITQNDLALFGREIRLHIQGGENLSFSSSDINLYYNGVDHYENFPFWERKYQNFPINLIGGNCFFQALVAETQGSKQLSCLVSANAEQVKQLREMVADHVLQNRGRAQTILNRHIAVERAKLSAQVQRTDSLLESRSPSSILDYSLQDFLIRQMLHKFEKEGLSSPLSGKKEYSAFPRHARTPEPRLTDKETSDVQPILRPRAATLPTKIKLISATKTSIEEEGLSLSSSSSSSGNEISPASRISPALREKVGVIFNRYLSAQDVHECNQQIERALTILTNLNISMPEQLDGLLARAQKRDKKILTAQMFIGAWGYALPNMLFEIANRSLKSIELASHPLMTAYTIGANDYLFGQVFSSYFEQAYYEKTIDENLPDVVKQASQQWDAQKEIGLVNDFSAMFTSFAARHLGRLVLNRVGLHMGGLEGWEAASSTGDIVGGPLTSIAVSDWCYANQRQAHHFDPVHLLARQDAEETIRYLMQDQQNYRQERKKALMLLMRDLPQNLGALLSPHGLFNSLLIMSVIEFLSGDAQKGLATLESIDKHNIANADYQKQLREITFGIDAPKLIVYLNVILPMLFTASIYKDRFNSATYNFGKVMADISGVTKLSNSIWRNLPDMGLTARLVRAQQQLSQQWYQYWTPPEYQARQQGRVYQSHIEETAYRNPTFVASDLPNVESTASGITHRKVSREFYQHIS